VLPSLASDLGGGGASGREPPRGREALLITHLPSGPRSFAYADSFTHFITFPGNKGSLRRMTQFWKQYYPSPGETFCPSVKKGGTLHHLPHGVVLFSTGMTSSSSLKRIFREGSRVSILPQGKWLPSSSREEDFDFC